MLRSVPVASVALLMAICAGAAESAETRSRTLSLEIVEARAITQQDHSDQSAHDAMVAEADRSDVLVAFLTGNCQATFAYDVAVTRINGFDGDEIATSMLGRVICGEDFIVHGLHPGRYRLELLQEYATSDDHEWAVLEFEMTSGGDVTLTIGSAR